MKIKKAMYFLIIILFSQGILAGCKKEFLDKKPNTKIVVPTSLSDMMQLLDKNNLDVGAPALGMLSGEEFYYTSIETFNSLPLKTEKNAYLWKSDIYEGERAIPDWNNQYKLVFTANVVLEQWEKLSDADKNSDQGRYIKAWALFQRSNSFYNLIQLFSPGYDKNTAATDLGIPIKLKADINDIQQRKSVQESYNQILSDLESSVQLYSDAFYTKTRNRPSKSGLYALLARIYLGMGEFKKALDHANNSLLVYDKLIDYNSIDNSVDRPFDQYNDELIFNSAITLVYNSTITGSAASVAIDPALIRLYSDDDLRKKILYSEIDGMYYLKDGYSGSSFPSVGFAVDEVYLIKAECLVRTGDYQQGMNVLNELLKNRWNNKIAYPVLVASGPDDALTKILIERRKELIWRGLRWYDLKRLNKQGANITLTRELDGKTYSLPPNDPRYVLPIPDDEIALSHIQQNNR